MASKDPRNPADMLNVYISEARCNSHSLRTSKRYRLHFTAQPPATVVGLRSPKAQYVKATQGAMAWKDPFGAKFTVAPLPIDCRAIINLCERRFGRSGQILATWSLDLSSATGEEIRLDLKGGADGKFGDLTICVASSLASTGEAVKDAKQAAEPLGRGLVSVNTMPGIPPLATEIINSWPLLWSRLDALLKVADTLAEVHPWIKLTWGVVSAVYRAASEQSRRDAKVMDLVQTMADTCSFADEAEALKERSKKDQDIINQILWQVMECAYFIRDYCGDKSFVGRTLMNMVSPVDPQIDTYKGTLETLRKNLIDNANIQCAVITYRVLDVVDEVRDLHVLSDLEYARQATLYLDQGCLPGTRTEIIDDIVHWALGADTPSSDSSGSTTSRSKDSRVLWLCGTAGAGKTSILRSCAERISGFGRKGSYYGFDKHHSPANPTNPTNLFSTVARDLADLDISRKRCLVDAVKDNTAIRMTQDCNLQFKHFIIAPFKDDKAVGKTVVFIDAFDESGDVRTRADALAILTTRASELPPGLRFVVTSRYEPDIRDALQPPLQPKLPPGVHVMHVEDIPTDQTSRDIATYMRNELHNVEELRENYLGRLIRMAGTSFLWAATACRFIRMETTAGLGPEDRIAAVLRSDEKIQYALYSTIMMEHCDPSKEAAVKRVKSMLGRIIYAQEPLPLDALVHLAPPDSDFPPDDLKIQQGIVRHLASLLSGTHSDSGPIKPLHSSYRDFLCDRAHNKDFYIDEGEANQQMALACFRVMDQNLTFNIGQIPSSFARNIDISKIIGQPIPNHLSYACQFWAFHASATPSSRVTQRYMESFFQKHFLSWLEVMSLTQCSPKITLAPLNTSHMVVDLIDDAMQFIKMFETVITTSVPHIYLSSLIFAPTSSLLYQWWKDQFPEVEKLGQGQLQHWPMISEGHHDATASVAFPPDGKQIAFESRDRTIQLCNVETGASIGWPVEGCDHGILCIAFSPNDEQIASDSKDNTVKISWLPPHEPKHGPQYPVHLVPLSQTPFRLDNGWILGPDDELILWIPPAYRTSLQYPHCHIMGSPNNNQIDFQHLKCGKGWAQCGELLGFSNT